MKTKSLTLSLIIIVSLISCKKDSTSNGDGSLKTITYTFVPNGASSQVIYTNLETQRGEKINAGYKTTIYSVDDKAVEGQIAHLQMSTTAAAVPEGFSIRITYKGKEIASASSVTNAAGLKYVMIDKTLTASDFK